jgi:hypothetical protein
LLTYLEKKCEGFARATKRPVRDVQLRWSTATNNNHTKPFAKAIGLV